jgi:putative redox protein
MTEPKPPMVVSLIWDGDLRFTGQAGPLTLGLDGSGAAAPSPMHALAFALGGCMAVDVVNILRRGRHPVQALEAVFTGQRAPGPPARFTAIELRCRITGEVPADAIERAIELSREKYCSVWHSLREDIAFTTSYEIQAGQPA